MFFHFYCHFYFYFRLFQFTIFLFPRYWKYKIVPGDCNIFCFICLCNEGYDRKKNRRGAPYRAVKNKHIQLLHDGSKHWLLTFYSNGRILICDSLKTSFSWVNRKCVLVLYRNCVKEFIVIFLPVQKQTDGYNCSHSAIAFAAEILDGKSPMKAPFDVERMRGHLMDCLENKFLII